MASLLPSLSSDEEEEVPIHGEPDSDDDDDHAVNPSFSFGGILGEDGPVANGWSYQTALDSMKHSDPSSIANRVPRLHVDALISAKRKSMVASSKQNTSITTLSEPNSVSQDENSDDSKNDDSDSSDDDDDDDSSSDEEEGPADESHAGLEDDVLKVRTGKTKKGKSKKKKAKQSEEEEEEGDNNNNTNNNDAEEEEEEEEEEEDENNNDDNNNQDDDDDEEDAAEAAKAADFFQNPNSTTNHNNIRVFHQLSLSRPLLRGVAAMGFVEPTPIQAQVIPVALTGQDICGSAVTGSGKTAAFLLPLLERVLHRQRGRIRALILTPTRELAAQCLGMWTTLAQFTHLRAALIVGGAKNLHGQAAELRARPEVVVATPGRMLDHVTNSTGVSLDEVEVLVLDEADRLLDLGFADEVHELVKACPLKRQTLLFSATMNTRVDELVKLSLKRPVRVRVSSKTSKTDIEVAPRLEQEFVRIRASNEGVQREAMLLSLLKRTFTNKVIVFFDTKVTAHRIMILCGLVGIKCAELHGNLTQQQRLTALDDFASGTVDVLMATDLAARGLDMERVQTVINFEMPAQIETYIHRIGRTARAGRGGQSCTLIGEGRRHLMKELIKDADSKKQNKDSDNNNSNKKDPKTSKTFETGLIRSRSIPAAVVTHFVQTIAKMEGHIQEILQAEEVARMDRIAEMEAIRAQNLIEHADEIKGRPQREWFASKSEKKAQSKQARDEKLAGTGTHNMTRKKRRAREALESLAEYQQQQQAQHDGDDSDDNPAPVPKVRSVQGSVRQKKRQEEAARLKKQDRESLHDLDLQQQKRQKRHAAGDSTLFDEEHVTSQKKKKSPCGDQVMESQYHFRGYNPDRKLGKKKGSSKFKSRVKYRRR